MAAPAVPVLRIAAECGLSRARAGELRLPHGAVPCPVFMPVGTRGTAKGLTAAQLAELGCRICLGNTFHLGTRPVSGAGTGPGGPAVLSRESRRDLGVISLFPVPLSVPGAVPVLSRCRYRALSIPGSLERSRWVPRSAPVPSPGVVHSRSPLSVPRSVPGGSWSVPSRFPVGSRLVPVPWSVPMGPSGFLLIPGVVTPVPVPRSVPRSVPGGSRCCPGVYPAPFPAGRGAGPALRGSARLHGLATQPAHGEGRGDTRGTRIGEGETPRDPQSGRVRPPGPQI